MKELKIKFVRQEVNVKKAVYQNQSVGTPKLRIFVLNHK